MRLIKTKSDMIQWSSQQHREGKKITFVPTMGALHEGHLTLMRDARNHGDLVVVSIFVNPTQFNDPKDYEKYTRDLEGDQKKCEDTGVDILFVPDVDEMYPAHETNEPVPLPPVALPLEGQYRPGHFEGVVMIVKKLFQSVTPDAALFGLKDYQQVRVIEEMVQQQKMGVTIIRCPTVRESDGLAMSSRNVRLSPEGRVKALTLSKCLKAVYYLYSKGNRDALRMEGVIKKECAQQKITLDYASVVDATTLLPVTKIEGKALVAVAGFVEGVRLIDNCLLD